MVEPLTLRLRFQVAAAKHDIVRLTQETSQLHQQLLASSEQAAASQREHGAACTRLQTQLQEVTFRERQSQGQVQSLQAEVGELRGQLQRAMDSADSPSGAACMSC